ncbi:MAG: LUD domain-containing protein [Planctomycetia bacterium]|nr:LUD domain-containing protein [Planctomycetia bacterium]
MNTRDKILQKLRQELSNPEIRRSHSAPAVPEILARQHPSQEAMARQFSEELKKLSGDCFVVENAQEAATVFTQLARENGWNGVSSVDVPLFHEVVALPNPYFGEANGETDKRRLSEIPVSVVFPQLLLADTGSAVMCNRTAHERLNCYLPPVCVVVAKGSQLREHLPAAWQEIADTVRDPSLRGEYVLITGPSRTADIEKVSILGVHGPKRVIVLLLEKE